jgi:hypothetical protein
MDFSEPAVTSLDTRLSLPNFRFWIIRWLLFFLICLGLGYAGVQRYEPRQIEGLSDAAVYYRMVAGEEVKAREMRFRVLVPYVARPFHAVTRKFIDPPRAVFLALLIANSIFCASAACLLIAIGIRITGKTAVAMLAASLYLLNFALVNLHLSGLVDAGESSLILAVVLTLFTKRWWLLPLWGLLGALAKETFLPLAGMLALTWWLVAYSKSPDRFRKLLPVLAMAAVSLATVLVLRSTIAGGVGLSDMLVQTNAGSNSFGSRLGAMFSPTVGYVFIWLLPLGALRLSWLPRPWVWASLLSALTAVLLGAYRDIGGNVARPLFDILGPLLSLSAAIWLAGLKKPSPSQSGPES